jgi:hypothetical protein
LFAGLPQPDHVVVVIEENRSYADIAGYSGAPYINSLAQQGASFTQSFGVTHPSQPNYLALFSGSTQATTDDNVHPKFTGPDLYGELAAAGKTFAGYSESMPSEGFDGATSGDYARKHNPMTQFQDVPSSANKVFDSGNFPVAAGTNYDFLPAVSFVVPNERHNMHDGSRDQGDTWLHDNLDNYAQWALNHNSLLIVTWDEDDFASGNQIPTIVFGAHVKAGQFDETINHYNVLRTIEDLFGTAHANNAATSTAITDIWNLEVPITPTAPSDLSASAESASEISLAWTDKSSNETSFLVEWATDSDFTQGPHNASTPMDATTYVVSGLSAGTTYYFRVKASNAAGNSDPTSAVSAKPAQVVILDDTSPTGITGSGIWWRSAAVSGFYGDGYMEDGKAGKGAKNLRFTTSVTDAGTYRVFLRWSAAKNRPARVPVDVTSVAGTDTVRVNEKMNGGAWMELGTFNFDPAVGSAMITIRTGGTAGYVVVDAIKLEQTTFDADKSNPHRGTRTHPAKIRGNLTIRTIDPTLSRIPAYSDEPRPTRKPTASVSSSRQTILSSL